MKIIPLSELRNTSAVSKMVLENSPVFVTKQGGEHLVMLSHEMYEEMQKENDDMRLYIKVLKSEIAQLKNGGKTKPLGEVVDALDSKYEL
ncbi:MAG: type II toxin-antitoxin system Phd/YefM family antitoxin [Candidatus Spyradenecus sp.]